MLYGPIYQKMYDRAEHEPAYMETSTWVSYLTCGCVTCGPLQEVNTHQVIM
jgi:hypothetical protein